MSRTAENELTNRELKKSGISAWVEKLRGSRRKNVDISYHRILNPRIHHCVELSNCTSRVFSIVSSDVYFDPKESSKTFLE